MEERTGSFRRSQILEKIENALIESRTAGSGTSILRGEAIASISFAHDDAKEGVMQAISDLEAHGVSTEILSGMSRQVLRHSLEK